ncbi:MAG TPA: proton-conducting transporter membrane subunit [Candidatus Tumulicola sp.]
MIALLVAFALCIVGIILVVAIRGPLGRAIGFMFLGAAGIASLISAATALHSSRSYASGPPDAHLLLRMDAVSGFYIGLIGAIAVIVAVFALGGRSADERGAGHTAAASSCAVLLASLVTCAAGDVFLFLFGWELLALAFFWSIGYAGTDESAPRSAYVTLVVTHVAGGCLLAALLTLAHAAGSFEVGDAIAAGTHFVGASGGFILVLLVIGFGAKFGMLPLQGWMPYGYRSAPSAVAALMAGGALNVGFYGISRFVLAFPQAPLWLAIAVIAVGSVGAFFGISWAAGQRDMRALAAYSSVENSGIIFAAFGVAIAGRALHDPMLMGFALAAASVQIVAHAVAKSTLFLTIASVNDARSSTDLDKLGGLARVLPLTTLSAILSGMSLAALPPLAGFVGEWLVLESLMQAFRTGNVASEVIFALAGAIIGVAAGIAIVTFTKFVGIGLLGASRSVTLQRGFVVRAPLRGVGLLLGCAAIVGTGVFARSLLSTIAPSIDSASHSDAVAAMIGVFPLVAPAFGGFSSVSPGGMGLVLAGFTIMFWIVSKLFSRPASSATPAWTSGEPYRSWTQYGGTGYANPTRVILDVVTRTTRAVNPEIRTYDSSVRPFFELAWYRWLFTPLLWIASAVRATQSGSIGAYLAYILTFTILMLLLFPSIRHW